MRKTITIEVDDDEVEAVKNSVNRRFVKMAHKAANTPPEPKPNHINKRKKP